MRRKRPITFVTTSVLLSLFCWNSVLADSANGRQVNASPVNPTLAQAQTVKQVRYRPPNQGAPKRTQGAGARGCPLSDPIDLDLLIPRDHEALTSSGNPTFFWQLSHAVDVPMEFTLVEPGKTQPILVKRLESSPAGISKEELPSTVAQLEPGKSYRWSVAVVCNSMRRSNDIYAEGWVKRVGLSAEAEAEFHHLSPLDQALVSAEAGRWYDTLDALMTAQSNQPNNPEIQQTLASLLAQVGLSPVKP